MNTIIPVFNIAQKEGRRVKVKNENSPFLKVSN
jgi:hypothetical protein